MGQLAQEHAQLTNLSLQLIAVNDRISYVGKYADGLSKLGQYIERRDSSCRASMKQWHLILLVWSVK